MANTTSAQNAQRTSLRRNKINTRISNEYKVARKTVIKELTANNVKGAKEALSVAYSKIDFAAKKDVLHSKTASRYKSRLAAAVKKADTK